VSEGGAPERGRFGLFLRGGMGDGGGKWYGLAPKRPPAPDADRIAALDVSVLQDRILSPLFGIEDPRTDSRIDFVGGIRGLGELENRVRSGAVAAAFALHPTTLEDLMAVSDAGGIMPPKSTWFEPKLRDGLLSHWIQGREL
ncbi:MAG: hypothetical protein NDJ89_07215, partial [Oligoflexia bacterium]|nr:hypothetical protein [Oligoflexia bacterium]